MPNNMGIVRYILALAVIIAHFGTFTGTTVWFPVSSYNAVGGFFALSGFLIYGSYLRRPGDIRGYLRRRARRLLPSYWATVLLAALLLVFVSTLSASAYFSSSGFWKYLAANLTFLNFLAPDLPGVFASQPIHAVNGSLWTMKVEWLLYLSVPLVALLAGRTLRRSVAVFCTVYLLSSAWRICFLSLYESTGRHIFEILSRQFMGQLMYFYAGVLIYYFFDVLMSRRWLVISVCAILAALSSFIPFYSETLGPLVLAMIVIWFSMTGSWGTWEGRHDNVSYGMYLLHAPIIQTLVSLEIIPLLGIWPSLILSIILSFAVAYIVETTLSRLFKPRHSNKITK